MSQSWTDDVFASGHVGQTDLQNMENNFACLKSTFSGATAPSNPVAGMFWYDTTAHILKQRNEANNAWLNIYDLANSRVLNSERVGNVLLSGLVQTSRQIIAGTGLSGGGDLSANRTLSLNLPNDSVTLNKMQHGSIMPAFQMADEETALTNTGELVTVRTHRIYIPTDVTTIKMVARMKTSDGGVGAWIQFDINGSTCTIRNTTSTTYTWTLSGDLTLDVSALSGWQDLQIQIAPGTTSGEYTAYLQGYSFIWE